MHGTLASARELAAGVAENGKPQPDFNLSVSCVPPAPYLIAVREALGDSGVGLGAQDLSPEASGAFTGDVAASMLVDVGCTYVLIGHSERRQFHGEQTPVLKRKLARALEAGLHPICCVGEPLAVRQLGGEEAYVEDQVVSLLRDFLKPVDGAELAKPLTPQTISFAYEPIWAIGTGEVATPDQAQTMCAHFRRVLVDLGGDAWRDAVIQYGGSIKPDNAFELAKQADVDGMLVGGASQKADSFCEIIAQCAKALPTRT